MKRNERIEFCSKTFEGRIRSFRV